MVKEMEQAPTTIRLILCCISGAAAVQRSLNGTGNSMLTMFGTSSCTVCRFTIIASPFPFPIVVVISFAFRRIIDCAIANYLNGHAAVNGVQRTTDRPPGSERKKGRQIAVVN